MIPDGEWCLPEKWYILFWTTVIMLIIVKTIIDKTNRRK